jgi:hypothetical protein
MDEPKPTSNNKKRTINVVLLGVLASLTTVLTAIATLSETLKKAFDSLGPIANFPPIVWLLVAPILLIVVIFAVIFALQDRLAQRSRLLRGEALELRADDPESAHLKGREDAITNLYAL